MIRLVVLVLSLLLPPAASATTYYISPSGSNGNNGLSAGAPFLTFAYAINASRAWCDDTLLLVNGTYGDGTSTGKLSLSSVVCTQGNELTIQALNERKAKIFDNGTGYACRIVSGAYIIIDGLYCRSTDNNYLSTTSELGETFVIQQSNHITVRNSIVVNPNRYGNNHAYTAFESQDILFEDNEAYIFSRHCVSGGSSTRVVVRRQYCNGRGGKIPGGFSAGGQPLGSSDAVMTMYPCRDCIIENSIADATETPIFINEQNANYASSVLTKGNKVLGNICYKCNLSNGIVPNARNVADLNHTPQDILIRDNVFVQYRSNSPAILMLDCVNCTADHNTVMGTDEGTSAAHGIRAGDQSSYGATPAQASVSITNNLVLNRPLNGFMVSGVNTWSGTNNRSHSNGTAFSPSPPSNWGTTYTDGSGYGSCPGLWVPDGSVGKGQGTGGSDIGATILYRYVNGVLTTTPLWDQATGAFPFGEADSDGVNRVAGKSLFDLHTRMGVNSPSCPFPSGYAQSGPTNPSNLVSSTDLSGAHVVTIESGMDSLTVAVAARWDDYLNTFIDVPNGVTSSCGGDILTALTLYEFTPAGDRVMRTFGILNPTSGTCTLTPSFSGTNWSGWEMISVKMNTVGSYGATAVSSGLSSTPSVTVATAADEVVLGFLATSSVPTVSVGPGLIFTHDRVHPTKILRLSSLETDGANGGLTNWTLTGSAPGWIAQAVSLRPSGGGGGSPAVFTMSHYRCDGLLGQTATPEVTLGQLAGLDTPCAVGLGGALRLRVEIGVSVANSLATGIAPYCKKVGGSFAKVQNTFGSNYVRYLGPGIDDNIPVDGTPTTKRFSGSPFQAGRTKRDGATPFILAPVANGTETEIDLQLVIGNGLTSADSVECEIRKDDGSTLGTHTNTITITPVTNSATMGF